MAKRNANSVQVRTKRRASKVQKPAGRVIGRGNAERGPASRSLAGASLAPQDLVQVRELFWNNVIREILTALSAMTIAAQEAHAARDRAAELASSAGTVKTVEGDDEADPFDGRMAVMLHNGTRVPIAGVMPLFACGVPGTAGERSLSMAVECTVFQITTPAGEAYTLPLHEIRGFHTLTDELMAQVTQAAQNAESEESESPFGFAAFTSLARGIPAPATNERRDGQAMSGEPAL